MLLNDERIFIDILKIKAPNVRNVNSYGKVLQTCSKAVKSRAAVSVKENAGLFVVTFDENSSPFLRLLDYSYWPFRDLVLVLRDAANVHTGKKKTARLFKSESDGP